MITPIQYIFDLLASPLHYTTLVQRNNNSVILLNSSKSENYKFYILLYVIFLLVIRDIGLYIYVDFHSFHITPYESRHNYTYHITPYGAILA